MAFSAAIVAGSCIGGVVFGILLGAFVILALLRRIDLPIGALFGKPGIEALRGDDQAGLAGLEDIYRSMLPRNSSRDLHHAGHVLKTLYFRIGNYAHNYLRGDCAGAVGPEQIALLDSLAGPQEDWHHLHEFDEQRRKSALIHFITRTLHRRIIPDGDLSITLLPVDILSTYQRILTKNPPLRASEIGLQRKTVSVQYWRALTACWCTEEFGDARRRNLTRPELMKMHCSEADACSSKAMKMADDDPRMPHLLETEELLLNALSPFFQAVSPEREPGVTAGLRADVPRQRLRHILELAADIGVTAFASEEPNEFFWPPTNRRPGCDPSANEGLLECFGVRTRRPVPGMEYDRYPVRTVVHIPPQYNDSVDYELEGPKGRIGLIRWWEGVLRKAPNGKPDQAMLDERTKRQEALEKFRKDVGEGHFPGWEGGVFF